MATMNRMPKHKRESAMEPHEFRDLLSRAGLTPTAAAAKLCVGRTTVWRWLSGQTPIAESTRILIHSAIKPRRK